MPRASPSRATLWTAGYLRLTVSLVMAASSFATGCIGNIWQVNISRLRGVDTSAKLTWVAPVINADLTPLTDLAGFKVYYGTTPGGPYTTTINVGLVTTYTVSSLPAGTYYFIVTAYDYSGNESVATPELSKTITGGAP